LEVNRFATLYLDPLPCPRRTTGTNRAAGDPLSSAQLGKAGRQSQGPVVPETWEFVMGPNEISKGLLDVICMLLTADADLPLPQQQVFLAGLGEVLSGLLSSHREWRGGAQREADGQPDGPDLRPAGRQERDRPGRGTGPDAGP